jgi:outer membrane murein-binding lipoprotein Lpp
LRATVLFALLVMLVLAGCASTARTDELGALRRENERLRGEIGALRAELAGRPSAAAESGRQLEQVFVPRSRVSVEVSTNANSGKTSVASLWYRTVDTKPLPRLEWLQVRADQTAAGALDGAWLVLERHGGRGSAKADSGRLSIDGRVIELRVTSYETSREGQVPGRVASGQRHERVSFALPAGSLAQVGTAISVHFEAGSVEFDLTDEHLAAFAAVAARVGP